MNKSDRFMLVSARILDDPLWGPRAGERAFSPLEAWIDLIQMAQYQPGERTIKGEAVRLERGEVAVGLRALARRWGWTTSAVRQWLQQGETEGRLSRNAQHNPERNTQRNRPCTVYHIVNYDRWQRRSGASDTAQRNTQRNTQRTNTNKGVTSKGFTSNTPLAPTASQNSQHITPQPAAENDGVDSAPPESPAVPSAAPAPRTAKQAPAAQAGSESGGAKGWPQEINAMAEAAGYYWPPSRVVRAMRAHVERDGWPWVKRVWASYLKQRPFLDYDRRLAAGQVKPDEVAVADRRFVRPEDCAEHYGEWDRNVTPLPLLKVKDRMAAQGVACTGDVSARAQVVA